MIDEAAALNSLFEKYKPSQRDFILARMAARMELIEIMLVELSCPHGSAKKLQLSERNVADGLALTEGYLKTLSKDGPFGFGKAPASN